MIAIDNDQFNDISGSKIKFHENLPKHIDEILMRTCFILKKAVSKELLAPDSNEKRENLKDNISVVDCYSDLEPFKISYLSRFTIGENIFDPNNENNIAYELVKVISENIPCEFRKKLASNIVLSGGVTMFVGFYQRFIEEIKELVDTPDFKKIQKMKDSIRIHKVVFPRNCLHWIGASLMNGAGLFNNLKRKIKTAP